MGCLWVNALYLCTPQMAFSKKPILGQETARTMTDHELLRTIYAAFNRRDIDTVLATMHPDVDWPNGMEGGRIWGREAVRQYWLRQWNQINPVVEPQGVHTDPTGAIVVEVHQVICDLAGVSLADRMVQHVYRIEGGLIRSMEIKEGPGIVSA
jgi:ketosteroid isomerase-like protein